MRRVIRVLVLLVALYVAYPFFTLWRLSQAVKQGDEAALTTLVDWPKLRQGFKTDASGAIDEELAARQGEASDPRDLFGAALARIVAPAIAGGVIDALVTPQGLASLIRTGNARASGGEPAASGGESGNESDMKISYAFFQSPTVFRVVLQDKDDSARKLPMLLELEGASWRLTRVYLR
jgi:hypothetical protein